MYDENRRIVGMAIDESQRKFYIQKGLYEHLLCADCECKISKYEQHAKRVFYDEFEFFETDIPNKIKVVNLEYKMFKLFQLSVLWRASVSSLSFFANIKLGSHEDKIRQMLIKDDPGRPDQYGCAIFGLFLGKGQAFDAIITPGVGRVSGHRTYKFIFGSCLWFFVVSSHSISSDYSESFLTTDGTLELISLPARNINPF